MYQVHYSERGVRRVYWVHWSGVYRVHYGANVGVLHSVELERRGNGVTSGVMYSSQNVCTGALLVVCTGDIQGSAVGIIWYTCKLR